MRRNLCTSVVSLVAGAAVMGLGASAGGQCVWLNWPLPFSGTNPGFEGPSGLVTETPGGSSGAVGPNHVVTVEGSMVWMRRRAGFWIDVNPTQPPPPAPPIALVDVNEPLETFFAGRADPALGLALSKVFAASVRYDRVAQRWFVAGVGIDWNAPVANDYKVLLAASDGDDPTGAWSVHVADADATNTRYPEHVTFGFNDQWIAIAANLYQIAAPYAFARNGMWVLQKSQTYSWVQPRTAVMDVGAMPGFGVRNGYESYAMRPAVSEDSSVSGALYIVDLYRAPNGNGVPIYRLSKLEGAPDAPVWSCVPGSAYNATTGPEEIGWFDSGQVFNLAVPDAEQPGPTQMIATAPIRGVATVQDAVVRNGMLWFTNTAGMPAGGSADRSVVVWSRVALGGTVPMVADESGMVDGGTGVWHYAPSIAVNCRGDMAVGFTRSGVTEFASSAWAVRGAIDPPGTVRAVEVAKAGVAEYEEPNYAVPGAAVAPWGGWSSACVDTMDDQSFWVMSECAETKVAYGPPHNGDGGLRGLWMEPVIAPACEAPAVLSQPAAQAVCPGAVVQFAVTNSGFPNNTYQWRRNGASMTDGGRYSGVNTPTLAITGVNSSDHNTVYTCVIENPCGSTGSNAALLTVRADVPAAPLNLSATDGTYCDRIELTWSASANATSYQVYRATVNNPASAAAVGTPRLSPSYSETPPQSGITYYYWVKAINLCGQSPFSGSNAGMAVAPGATPTGLSATNDTSCVQTTVSWNAVSGVTRYGVYRGTTTEFVDATLIATPTATSIADTTAVQGTTYRYWVASHNVCGYGTAAGSVVGKRSLPPAPTGVNASVFGSGCDRIRVSWTGPADATGHAIYRGMTGSFADAAQIGTSATSPYMDSSIVAGQTYRYWVRSTTSCGQSAEVGPVTVLATEPVWIAVDPANTTGIRNQPVTMTVQARGTGPLTYQWHRGIFNQTGAMTAISNNSVFQGATTATLTINDSEDGEQYYYKCVVGNWCGTEESNAAFLDRAENSCQGVTIDSQPGNRTVCTGTSLSLNVETDGTSPVTYVWRKDGVIVPGANMHELPLYMATAADSGVYTCTVSNGCGGPITSASATVTVNEAPMITQQPAGGSRCVGGGISFLVGATSGPAVSYQWRKDGAAIGGATQAGYTRLIQSGADAGSYDCVVSNSCGTVTSAAATLVVGTGVPTITVQPAGASKCAGESHTFTVAATGSALVYQWYWSGSTNPIAGATESSYTIPSLAGINSGSYTCRVTNPCGTTTSAAAVMNVNITPTIITNPFDQVRCVGQSVTFQAFFGGASVAHQWKKDGVNIPGATSSTYTIASVALTSAGVYECVGTNPCGAGSSAAATLTVSVMPTIQQQPAGGTVCAGQMHRFSVTAFAGGQLSYQWYKGGLYIPGANASVYTVVAAAAGDAGQYTCRVSNMCGLEAETTGADLIVAALDPVITIQPAGGTIGMGASLTLTVSAEHAAGYQWRRDGGAISGADAASYTIVGATGADAGSYECVVSGVCGGQAVSGAAVVVVRVADFNGSGTTTVQDLFDFLSAYFAMDPRADVNGSGTWTVQDIFDYLGAYFRG